VTRSQIERWAADETRETPIPRAALLAETSERIGEWNELGGELCEAFLAQAERAAQAA